MRAPHRSVLRSLPALGVALLATACGGAERDGAVEAAILAGEPAPDATAVVAVVNFAGGQCSGSLIAPRLVLTARHCVADTAGKEVEVLCGTTKFQPPDSPGAIFVVPRPEITDDPKDYLAVSEIRMLEGASDELCGSDVVLLRLEEPLVDITPLAPRLDEAVRSGEAYSAVGYGVDASLADEPSGVRKRGEGYEVRCSGAACRDGDVQPSEWVGNGGPCSGDSGGPALDAAGRIVGVVSRGKPSCTEPVFSDVVSRADWLRAELMAVTEPEAEVDPGPQHDTPGESCALSRDPRFPPVALLAAAAVLALLRARRNVVRVRRGSRL